MPVSHLLLGILVSFVLSVLLVGATLRYALRRGLLDAPGRRRSHTVATPRGGGLGLLLAVLAGPVLGMAGPSIMACPGRGAGPASAHCCC